MHLSNLVSVANNASAQHIQSNITPTYNGPHGIAVLQAQHASALNDTQRTSIWEIFQANMYNLYVNSSFGWNPMSKRKELFHPLSRFILVYSESTDKLFAFVMFRFETEEDENVIYCYDIQVDTSAQGMGLGSKLFDELSRLCKVYKMQKVMLTVLRANTRAFALYKRIGFVVDPTSPGPSNSEDEFDYEILSRSI